VLDPATLGCPQVSESPSRITGFPPTRTEPDPPEVTAEQCMPQPSCPQQGCGDTEIPGTTMGRPFTRTEATPEVFTPLSCLDHLVVVLLACYPIKILLRTGLIPVVASK
jgi:hypothetical protein